MLQKSFNVIINQKISNFKKSIIVDADKSTSIRILLIGAISEGISSVENILESDDVLSAIKCLRKLGVKIVKRNNLHYIYGKGLGSLVAKKNISLDFGNSGTLARLLMGLLSTNPDINLSLTGDNSLKKRSMKKLILLMSEFGATFKPSKKFNFPFRIISSKFPIGIDYESGVSAQLKSAVIFAGLNSFGVTKILEKKKSRDHTENMLLKNNEVIKIINKKNKLIIINGKRKLNSLKISVPGDPSSGAFFSALTILKKNSSMKITNIGLNPTRIGFYKLLKKHGAKINFKNIKQSNNELYGDIHVKYSNLKPIKASKDYYVNSTDEYPILFVIAALTKGVSKFKGIGDLVNKESNRILEMQKILSQVGIKSVSTKDELKIFGKEFIDPSKKKIIVKNLGDHRICMSAFVLSVLTGVKAKINSFETVFTSSPSFLKIMKNIGAKFEIQK
tara:strand:- start:269 stop:1612 length:1344 start_codon:yes stop_codon:yes gene_type:complete